MRSPIKFLSYISISLLIIIGFSCNTTEPPPPGSDPEPELTLKLDDVSCTEAWIELSAVTLQLPATIELSIDSTIDQVITLSTMDTLLYIDSLLPNTTYQFQASVIEYPASGSGLTVTTLEPTEHNINWQVFTFGEHGHSIIRDVTIIDENNIWAVGEIYLLDSLGNNDHNAYNAIHWDGKSWNAKRITVNFRGNAITPGLEGVFAFSVTDIWFVGSLPIHGDGENWIMYDLRTTVDPNLSLSKLWGSSSNNIYFVGRAGSVAHYNGTSWRKMQTPLGENTDIDLLDIWGDEDGTIWSCGDSDESHTTALLKKTELSGWEIVYHGNANLQNNGYNIGYIRGIWGTGNKRIYLMNGEGIFLQPNSKELFLERQIAETSVAGFSIDGTDDNNLFICGFTSAGHWNGVSYVEYPKVYSQNRRFYSTKVTGSTVCVAGRDYNGFIYSQAVIAIGRQ